jgi:hypothetical protein
MLSGASVWVYNTVSMLAVPGQKMEGAGVGIAGGLNDASNKVNSVPGGRWVAVAAARPRGQRRQRPRRRRRAQQHAVHNPAIALVVLVLVVPVGVVLFGWLPRRVRWIRRASLAATLKARTAGQDLLALRALTRQPLRRLLTVSADPATAWREHDPQAVNQLATLELRTLGLRS